MPKKEEARKAQQSMSTAGCLNGSFLHLCQPEPRASLPVSPYAVIAATDPQSHYLLDQIAIAPVPVAPCMLFPEDDPDQIPAAKAVIAGTDPQSPPQVIAPSSHSLPPELSPFEGLLQPHLMKPFFHKGEWSLHQIIPALIQVFGPCEVRIATFNISEESIRPLFFLVDSGEITQLHLLIDTTVRRHKLDLLLFAANITPSIAIDNCHAKVLLVSNDKYRFGVVGSANLNTNHRWESGFWFTESTFFDYFTTQYTEAYNGAIQYGSLDE